MKLLNLVGRNYNWQKILPFFPRQVCGVCDSDQDVIHVFVLFHELSHFISSHSSSLPVPLRQRVRGNLAATHDPTAILMWKNTPSGLEAHVKSNHFCRNVGLQLSGCSKNRWISILGCDKDPNTHSSVWQGRNTNPGAEGEKEAIWKNIKRRCEQIPRLRLVNTPFCWLNCETVKLVTKGKSSLVALPHYREEISKILA